MHTKDMTTNEALAAELIRKADMLNASLLAWSMKEQTLRDEAERLLVNSQ